MRRTNSDEKKPVIVHDATRATDDGIPKVLILGTCLSGKSTVYKRFIELYGSGYNTDERQIYRGVIASNIVQAIQVLVTQSQRFGYTITAGDAKDAANRVANEWKGDERGLTNEMARDVQLLWNDQAIQATYHRRYEFQWLDHGASFIQRAVELAAPTYVTTVDDILRSRVRTTGIVEGPITMAGQHVRIFDVGGARNERKKWIHCFDANMILFVAAMSEYDQMLYEDDRTNRMTEALRLFGEIIKSERFASSHITLWLTKRDEFAAKIHSSPLANLFPDYEGGSDYPSAQKFVIAQFLAQNRNPSRIIDIEVVDLMSSDEARIACGHFEQQLRAHMATATATAPLASSSSATSSTATPPAATR